MAQEGETRVSQALFSEVFWASFAQPSLCGTSGTANVLVTDKDWIYKE